MSGFGSTGFFGSEKKPFVSAFWPETTIIDYPFLDDGNWVNATFFGGARDVEWRNGYPPGGYRSVLFSKYDNYFGITTAPSNGKYGEVFIFKRVSGPNSINNNLTTYSSEYVSGATFRQPNNDSALAGGYNFALQQFAEDDGLVGAITSNPTSGGGGRLYYNLYEFSDAGVDTIASQEIKGSDIPGITDEFGTSVAVSSDGLYMVVSDRKHTLLHTFDYNETLHKWEWRGTIGIPSYSNNNYFGTSLEVSDDKRCIIVGHPSNLPNSDLVHIYTRDDVGGEKWTATSLLSPSQADNTNFGYSTALTTVGSAYKLVVGAPAYNVYGVGEVHYYEWDVALNPSGGFELTDTFTLAFDSLSDNCNMGVSVSVSSDGTVIAAGAPRYGEPGTSVPPGGCVVYKLANGTWTETVLVPDLTLEEDTDLFMGASVALSSDGSAVLCGMPEAEVKAANGQVYVDVGRCVIRGLTGS